MSASLVANEGQLMVETKPYCRKAFDSIRFDSIRVYNISAYVNPFIFPCLCCCCCCYFIITSRLVDRWMNDVVTDVCCMYLRVFGSGIVLMYYYSPLFTLLCPIKALMKIHRGSEPSWQGWSEEG